MNVLNNENVVLVDVDDTIVVWDRSHRAPGKGKIKFTDPYSGDTLYLTPHSVHIRLIRQYKGRGFAIIVASMAGVKWAEHVVKTLQLEQYVDICMSKPTRYIDDKEDIKDIIGTRIFLKNDIE